jgi:hypothetical protein
MLSRTFSFRAPIVVDQSKVQDLFNFMEAHGVVVDSLFVGEHRSLFYRGGIGAALDCKTVRRT